MRLSPAELLGVLPALPLERLVPLSGRLLPVMPSAERGQVGLSMVITGQNVVHVGRRLRATNATFVTGGAAVAIAAQDALSEGVPVSREALPPI